MAAVSELEGGELLYESLRRQQTVEHSARKASKTAVSAKYAEPASYRISPRTQGRGEQGSREEIALGF